MKLKWHETGVGYQDESGQFRINRERRCWELWILPHRTATKFELERCYQRLRDAKTAAERMAR
jgi:hypothetical protein